MTKDKVFFGCVQLLLTFVRLCPETKDYFLKRGALDVLARAGEIPEEALPDEVGQAAEDFVAYAIGAKESPAPEWYVDWLDSFSADVRPKW